MKTSREIENMWEYIHQLGVNLRALKQLVEDQANDEGLWFKTTSITEAYLQQELRKLHDAVEKIQL